MFSPPLYTIRKFNIRTIIDNNYNLILSPKEEKKYYINQSDNMMFRQVRLVTKNDNKYNPYIIFIDCKGFRKKTKELDSLLRNGFYINGIHMIFTEKSASMSRHATLGFIDENIKAQIDKIITMDLDMKKTVISKYLAYRGLMFSSCFCIENWYPKVIVVDDYKRIIPNQYIKYMVDKEVNYIDKSTKENKVWKEKGIAEGYKDVEIMPFDGCGLHHPSITQEVKSRIGISTEPTSIMWRLPFVKGVTHEFDYTSFLLEKGITKIKDIWGIYHDVNEPMIIMTKSMYKGYKYFKKNGDISDWNNYWEKFKKYNHCIGVAKWNFGLEEEPIYTRVNYQILQDLDLDYDDFVKLSDDSIDWVQKIINGDKIYTYCFLGLFADHIKPSNIYMEAVLKNSEMLKDECVRKYLNNLLKKYINEFKCGKLWLKSSFRILTPDLIMLAEYIGGIEQPEGILKSNEFYSKGIDGVCQGEWLIERNPHICASEHVVLNGVNNDILQKYCGKLTGITMINGKSITLQKLNSADVDGDLVLNVQNNTMKMGVNRDLPTTMDTEDKITVPEEEINIDNIIKSILLSMDNRIGEYSNVSTGYHNKCPKTPEQKQKYIDYTNLISILNGKEIDAAKTGYRVKMSSYISRYSKPLPYFMKYAGVYYSNLKKLNHSKSNMNRLCKDLEKWSKQIRYKYKYKDFNYKIMINNDIAWNDERLNKIENIYLDFCKQMRELAMQNNMNKKFANYDNYYGDLNKEEIVNTKINWQYYYEIYLAKTKKVCKNEQERANYAVYICYNKYKNKDKKFAWIVAGDGIIKNLKQVNIQLPLEDKDGQYEYLGRKYKLVDYKGECVC